MRQTWSSRIMAISSSRIISRQSIWFSKKKTNFYTNEWFNLFIVQSLSIWFNKTRFIDFGIAEQMFFCIFVELIFRCVCFIWFSTACAVGGEHLYYGFSCWLRKYCAEIAFERWWATEKNHTNSYYCKSWQRRWASIDNSHSIRR